MQGAVGRAPRRLDDIEQGVAGGQREAGPDHAAARLQKREVEKIRRHQPQHRKNRDDRAGHQDHQPVAIDVGDAPPQTQRQELGHDHGAGVEGVLQIGEVQIAQHEHGKERSRDRNRKAHRRAVDCEARKIRFRHARQQVAQTGQRQRRRRIARLVHGTDLAPRVQPCQGGDDEHEREPEACLAAGLEQVQQQAGTDQRQKQGDAHEPGAHGEEAAAPVTGDKIAHPRVPGGRRQVSTGDVDRHAGDQQRNGGRWKQPGQPQDGQPGQGLNGDADQHHAPALGQALRQPGRQDLGQ